MNGNRNARELNALKNEPTPRIVGLTGGIGSGKTVVTETLKSVGFKIVDADEISRELFKRGSDGEKHIVRAFPKAARKDGSLDRKKLRAVISSDSSERIRLNGITHPLITDEIMQRLATEPPPIVLSAPLLFESALARFCDCTVCVYCPRAVKISRISSRDGITADEAEKIIDAQIPDTERCTLADFIIPSDVPIDEFKKETVELFKSIFGL